MRNWHFLFGSKFVFRGVIYFITNSWKFTIYYNQLENNEWDQVNWNSKIVIIGCNNAQT